MNGSYEDLCFQTPPFTRGDVVLPGTQGTLVSRKGWRIPLVSGVARNLAGGMWKLEKTSE